MRVITPLLNTNASHKHRSHFILNEMILARPRFTHRTTRSSSMGQGFYGTSQSSHNKVSSTTSRENSFRGIEQNKESEKLSKHLQLALYRYTSELC